MPKPPTPAELQEQIAARDQLVMDLQERLRKHIDSSAERHRRAASKIASLEVRVGQLELQRRKPSST